MGNLIPFPSWGGSLPISSGRAQPHLHSGGTQSHLIGVGVLLPREKAATPTAQHLNPMDVLYRMDALLPPDSLLVADGGDFVGTAAYIVRPRRPLSWLDPGEDPRSAPPPPFGGAHTAEG